MAYRAPKVRVVKCPKCWKLLPELPNIPVYQCGGCGTTLKAKRRKEDQESDCSEAFDNNSAQKNEAEHDSESKESACSSQKAILSPTEGCEQVESQDSDAEKSGSRRISNVISSSSELNFHEEEESSSEVGGNKKTDGEVQHEERKFSLLSLNEKHDPVVVGSVSRDQDELPEHTRYGIQKHEYVNSHDPTSFHPVQNWLGLETEESIPKERFNQRDSSASNGNGSRSNYRYDRLLWSSSFNPPNKLDNVERNQMELLRKVDELRDQLNKSYGHSRKADGRFPTRSTQQEKQLPLHYNQKLPDQDVLQHYDVHFTRHFPGAYRPRKSIPHHCGFTQMPLPGNGMNCRHHSNCSCSHAFQENWQCLQKLPPPNICYNEGLCKAYPGHMCYNPYNSSHSSPERQLHSHYPLMSRDAHTQPCDQMDIGHEVGKLHHKERHQRIKRHFRPIGGAAPFIMCYSCRRVLHLPADFLISNQRCHRLQCGSCSKVLAFTKRTHIVPCSRNLAVPPPSEVHSSIAYTSIRNSASTSRAKDYAQGDPLSYSEDLGLSICKSVSTEGDPAFLIPEFSALSSNAVDKRQPSSSLIDRIEENRKNTIMKQSGNKQKISIQPSYSSSPSFHEAKQPEARPLVTASPLHRLMGYSSAREMLNASSE